VAKSAPDPARKPSATVLLPFVLTGSLVAILGLLARPAFESRVFANNDLAWSAVPTRYFYALCLTRGDSPYWWPDVWCGFYLHAEDYVGMRHPWHWLLYRALPFVAAFNVEFLTSYLIMVVGMVLFLRRWGLSASASLLGAGLYAFLGFNLFHYIHMTMTVGGAHLPLLLVAADGVMRGREARSAGLSALGLAALTTSNILLAHPQAIWMCGLAVTGYAVMMTRSSDLWVRRLAMVVAAQAIGAVGGAVQLLPTYSLMQQSDRASVSSRFLAAGSTHPLNWVVQPLAPYLFRAGVVGYPEVVENATYELRMGPAESRTDFRAWETGVYGGAVLPALLAWLAMRRRGLGSRRPLVVASVALAALGIVLTLGKYLPIFELTRRLPGFGFFRDPGRYVLIANCALATLAAVAFDDLLQVARKRAGYTWRSLWPLAVVALMAVVVPVGIRALGLAFPETFLRDALSDRRYIPLGIVLVGGAAGLVALAARGRRSAVTALALLAMADVGLYDWNYLGDAPQKDIEAIARSSPLHPPQGAEDATAPGQEGRLSVAGEEQSDEGPTMRGTRFTEGYTSLRPRRRLDYHATAALRVAGAAWVNHRPRTGHVWEPVPDPLPRARLVTRAQVSADPKGDLAGIDVATTALVDADLGLPGGPAGRARLLSDRPGSITVATDSPTRQLLVVSESFHDGWRVRVDGQPQRPPLRVYGDFLGCVVEAGSHRVEFTFDPGDLRIGTWISTAVAALMGAGAIMILVEGRPGTSTSPRTRWVQA